MIIKTFEHQYPVIGIKEGTDIYDIYICRDHDGRGLCRIISIKDRSVFHQLVNWLSETINQNVFTDFREYFIYNDCLCIVMKYTQGLSLSAKLATESVPFRERLELARRILEKAVLQDIPDFFLAKCFVPEEIIVSGDLSVSFNYPVGDIIDRRDQKGRSNIEVILRLIFAPEIECNIPDELMAFINRLPELTSQRLLDLYSEYYLMMSRVQDYDELSQQPKTIWYSLWEKTKRAFGVMKKVIIIILILAAIGYLIFTIIDPWKNNSSSGHFKTIGTVEIENSG